MTKGTVLFVNHIHMTKGTVLFVNHIYLRIY